MWQAKERSVRKAQKVSDEEANNLKALLKPTFKVLPDYAVID